MYTQSTPESRERANAFIQAMRQKQVDEIQTAINRHKTRPDLAINKIYKILGVE